MSVRNITLQDDVYDNNIESIQSIDLKCLRLHFSNLQQPLLTQFMMMMKNLDIGKTEFESVNHIMEWLLNRDIPFYITFKPLKFKEKGFSRNFFLFRKVYLPYVWSIVDYKLQLLGKEIMELWEKE